MYLILGVAIFDFTCMKVKTYLATIILFAACLACNVPPKKGLRLEVPNGQPRYFSHQFAFDGERADPVLNEYPPAGLVVVAQFGGRLNQTVAGARSLQELTAVLAEYPDLFPVVTTFLSSSLYPQLCGNGRLDDDLDKFQAWLTELDRPVGLVIGYQVDNPIWEVDPENYKEGFRCLVDRFTAAGLDHVAYGWHPNGLLPTYQDRPLSDWFPGTEYVSFTGLTLEKFATPHFVNKMAVTGSNFAEVAAISKKHAAPIIILEATPGAVRTVMPGSGDTLWNNFYRPLVDLLDEYDNIIAVAQHGGAPVDSLTQTRYRTEFISRHLTNKPLVKR